MKKILLSTLAVTAMFATDYSSMTLEELLSQKGTIASEDKADYQAAMKDKVQSLTPEQRAEYNIGQNSTNNSQGLGTVKRLKDGTGTGNMYKYKGSKGGGKN